MTQGHVERLLRAVRLDEHITTTELLTLVGQTSTFQLLPDEGEALEGALVQRAVELTEIVTNKIRMGTYYGVATQLGTAADLTGAAALVQNRTP